MNACPHIKVDVYTNMAYKHMFICKFSHATQTHMHMRHVAFLWPISPSQNKVALFPCLNISQPSLFSPPWEPPCSQETSAPLPTTLSLTPSTDLRNLCLSPGLSEGNSGERGQASRRAEAPLSDQTPLLFGSSELVFFLSLLQSHAL